MTKHSYMKSMQDAVKAVLQRSCIWYKLSSKISIKQLNRPDKKEQTKLQIVEKEEIINKWGGKNKIEIKRTEKKNQQIRGKQNWQVSHADSPRQRT